MVPWFLSLLCCALGLDIWLIVWLDHVFLVVCVLVEEKLVKLFAHLTSAVEFSL